MDQYKEIIDELRKLDQVVELDHEGGSWSAESLVWSKAIGCFKIRCSKQQ